MQVQRQQIGQLANKLQTLSQERITEVEDFIDYLRQRDENRQLTQLAMNVSQSTLNTIWDNAGDAEYGQLRVWRCCTGCIVTLMKHKE